jgi:hypothetical protein
VGQSLSSGVVGINRVGPVLCDCHPPRFKQDHYQSIISTLLILFLLTQECLWGSPSAVVWWESTDLVQFCVIATHLDFKNHHQSISTTGTCLFLLLHIQECGAVPQLWFG